MKDTKTVSKKSNRRTFVLKENTVDADEDYIPADTAPLHPTAPTSHGEGSDLPPNYVPSCAGEVITVTSSNSIVSCSSRSSYSSQKRSDSNDAFYPQSKSSRRLTHPPYPSSFTAAFSSASSVQTESDSPPAPISSEPRVAANHKDSPTCCTCRKSHCLKLYCACFKNQAYCNGECTCYNCYNNPRHEDEREDTISMMKAKNPHCFESHVDKKRGVNKVGCRCKKTHCDKKYCECFNAGVPCGDQCQCKDCKNHGYFHDL